MAFVGWDFCPTSLRIIYGRKIIALIFYVRVIIE